MTEDLVLRIGLVLGAVAVALIGALVLRRGQAVRRRRIRLGGLGAGLYLFTSDGCGTCDRMRERLATHPGVVELSYEHHRERFPATVRRVPAVAQLDSDGEGWIAYGSVSEGRLARWIADGP